MRDINIRFVKTKKDTFGVPKSNRTSKESIMRAVRGIVIGSCLFGGAMAAVGNNYVLKLSNRLGVETEVQCWDVPVGEGFPESQRPQGTLMLRLMNSAFVAAPLGQIENVTYSNGTHTIRMKTGREFRGALMGTVSEQGQNPRRYDLKDVQSLYVVSSPPPTKVEQSSKLSIKNDQYTLTITAPVAESYDIRRPRFAFSYYDSYKNMVGWNTYEWASKDFYKNCTEFIIKTHGEEIAANLGDFAEVTVQGKTRDITLKSWSGFETKGALLLKNDTKEAKQWLFMAELNDESKVTIMVIQPSFSLKGVPNQSIQPTSR